MADQLYYSSACYRVQPRGRYPKLRTMNKPDDIAEWLTLDAPAPFPASGMPLLTLALPLW